MFAHYTWNHQGGLIVASGILEGKDFTGWGIWKGREICHLVIILRGPLINLFETDAPYGCIV